MCVWAKAINIRLKQESLFLGRIALGLGARVAKIRRFSVLGDKRIRLKKINSNLLTEDDDAHNFKKALDQLLCISRETRARSPLTEFLHAGFSV